ncbi:aLK and LTK ligand 2a isoform X1 [Brachyhypopomus gauderio]|uniref:aLK and LTK ligand 2a isoform X1 n=1 Tax=Brachyhypopomus gauderio TaxID=698409 RepID=UPI0040419BF3
MHALRAPAVMGIVLLICITGQCDENGKTDKEERNHKTLLGRIKDMVRHTEQSTGGRTALSSDGGHNRLERKDSHKLRTESGEQILEIFPRDLRKKEKYLKHLTGPLYFSPKCRKHVYRLYHSSRDCTTPAYYKRCARLLTRLAGSSRCLQS